jgi:hypothetical protein
MRKVPASRWIVACAALGLAAALAAPRAAGDEFTLKDGRKISGTIVGYDQNMFRVQTDFGYVLIRKDMVISIRVEAGGEGKTEAPTSSQPSSQPEPGRSAPASPAAAPAASPTPSTKHVTLPPPKPPISRLLNEPLPAHVKEHVDGNDYVNDTFQFAMYKPPDWKPVEGLRREGIAAIVALSSPDERTLLFVDRQVWSGEPNLSDDRVEAGLRSTYQDYKQLSQSPAQVDGLRALRRTFTGVMDGAEWHGVSVRIEHGNTVFGIVGLTSAETYQFQQAVFNKMIRSFHFLSPSEGAGAALQGQTKP